MLKVNKNGKKKDNLDDYLIPYIRDAKANTKNPFAEDKSIMVRSARNSSKGCPTIDGRQWRSVERQLGKSSNIRIRITR